MVHDSAKGKTEEDENQRTTTVRFLSPVNYAQCVVEGIAEGQMTGRARTKFTTTVTSSIFGMKREPSKEELSSVTTQITQKYLSVGAGVDSGWGI